MAEAIKAGIVELRRIGGERLCVAGDRIFQQVVEALAGEHRVGVFKKFGADRGIEPDDFE